MGICSCNLVLLIVLSFFLHAQFRLYLLAQRLRIPRNEAKQIIDDYFRHFPSISYFIEDTLTAARENGYVETIFGRRRYIPDINSHNATVRALVERNAVNAPIQGTAADIIKIAMINVDRRMTQEHLKSKMVLQIHDELLFDAVPEEVEALKRLVVEEMENVVGATIGLWLIDTHLHHLSTIRSLDYNHC